MKINQDQSLNIMLEEIEEILALKVNYLGQMIKLGLLTIVLIIMKKIISEIPIIYLIFIYYIRSYLTLVWYN